MATTVIVESCVKDGQGGYSAKGTVNGRGYVVTIDGPAFEAAKGKGAQQTVIATALKGLDDALTPVSLDVAGTVVL